MALKIIIKKWKLRYREKQRGLCIPQIARLARMVGKYLGRSLKQKVLKVNLGITYRCQCKCTYCGIGKYPVTEEREISNARLITLLRQIADIPSFATAVSFFGGEPLLRSDVYTFIRNAHQFGLFTEMETNGILLTKENVEKLKDSKLHHIFVRIESSQAESHDNLSNYEGCFQKAIEGIQRCVRERIPCTLSTIAVREKIYSKELERIIEIGEKLGVSAIRLLYPTLLGNWLNAKEMLLTEEEKQYVVGLLEPGFIYLESTDHSEKRTGRVCASFQKKLFYISPYGELQPCFGVPLKFGVIPDDGALIDLVDGMWQSRIFQGKYGNECIMSQVGVRREIFQSRESRSLLSGG